MVTKLKNSNCNKIKNSNCNITLKSNYDKTQIFKCKKKLKNANCETKKIQTLTKLK